MNKGWVLMTCLILGISAQAADLGAVGPVYAIQEPDLLSWLKERARTLKDQGRWQTLQRRFQKRARQHARRPQPVPNLSRTTRSRTYTVDPSVQLSQNLTDARGRLLHRRGETVNPLHAITLHKRLILFNGDDRDQVNWVAAHRRTKADPHQSQADTLILVRGDVPRQAKRWHQPVYFDQHGQWCRRFHIRQVPAVVQQQGDRLQVREVRP